MRVFISHSSKNAEQAAEVCKRLEASGHSCFLAPRDIRSGYEYAEEIVNGIDSADIVLLLLSNEANSSPHVLREIERAVSKKKSIIVYKLEEVALSKSMEYFLMTHQWLSSTGNTGFDEIIQRINEYAASHSAGTSDAPQPEPAAAPSPAAEAKPEKNSRRRYIILIAAAAVILAAAGIITAVCLSSRSTGNSSEPAEITSTAEDNWFTTEEPEIIHTQEAQTADYTDTREELPTQTAEALAATEASQPEVASTTPQNEPAAEEVILPADTQTTQQPQTTTKPEETSAEPEITAAKVELGEALMFGTYNGEPIKWRVLRVSEDGTQAVAVANDILTMKAYDAAEGGEFNEYNGEDYWMTRLPDIPPEVQSQIRGDNRWELSNIRTWLNSSRENVTYSGQAPTSKAMSEKCNGYHTEAGFLNGFTKAELSALVETQITTNGTVTSDKVFLLSSDELEWLYEADVSIYAKPTAAAVEQDQSKWYLVDFDAYGVDDFFWWLRDANPDNSCECYYINLSCSEKQIGSGSVGLEGYGIRPAITLDLTSDAVKTALENSHDTN